MAVFSNLVLVFLSVIAYTAIALENGTFEFSAAGWKNVAGQYRYDRTAGRNGTGAIIFESTDPATDIAVPEQIIPVEAGRIYDFEAWLKCENLIKPGATVMLSLLRKDMSKIKDIYTGGVRGTKDWQRLVVRIPRLNSDVAFVRLRPCARKGAIGKCIFDDIDLRVYVSQPVGLIKSSAYRDEAFDGDVAFFAETSLDCAKELKLKDVYAEFSWKALDGTIRRSKADAFDGLTASWHCSVSQIAFGTNEISCILRKKDGDILGKNTLPFVRLSAPPKRTVMFDQHKRTLVNGKPFFPLGVYVTAFDTNAICNIANSDFNCFVPYTAPDRAGLDFCQEKGLKVFYICRDYPTEPFSDELSEMAQERNRLAERAKLVRNHPAVLAWYINDERPISMHNRLNLRYRALKELDPEHPVWSVLYQVTELRGYVDTSDVLGTDPYPVPGPLGMAAEWTRMTCEASFNTQPVWQVPQAFDWSLFRANTPSNIVACGNNRVPTYNEMRAMAWQCLAEGANGLLFYSYTALEKMDWRDSFAVKWNELCSVATEIKKYFPVLLSEPLQIAPIKGLSMRAWKHNGDVWILVCNPSKTLVKTKIVLPVVSSSMDIKLGSGIQLLDSGNVEAVIGSYGVSMIVLKEKR